MIQQHDLELFIKMIDECIHDFETVVFDSFRECSSIFVIRSVSMGNFRVFINRLKEINPSMKFYVLSHMQDRKDILDICGNNCEVIEYQTQSNYKLEDIKSELGHIKNGNIDKFVVLYNNRYGVGQTNIDEIMLYITKDKYYFYNCDGEFHLINSPIMRYKSCILHRALCDWFWECI